MVPTRSLRAPFDRHPIARESLVAVAAVVAFAVWTAFAGELLWAAIRTVGYPDVADSGLGTLVVHATMNGAALILAIVAFAAAYVRVRDVDVPLALPDRDDLPLVGAALVLPTGLIGLAKLVGAVTGTHLSTVTNHAVSAEATLVATGTVTLLGLMVTLPAYLVAAHVLVQRTFSRVADARTTVVLTVLLVTVVGRTDVLAMDARGALLGGSLLLAAIALPLYAETSYDRRWLTAACAVPLALFVVGALGEWVLDFQGAAGAVFGLAEFAVVAVGVYGYERTDSLVPSAVALACYAVVPDVIVFFFEAGVGI